MNLKHLHLLLFSFFFSSLLFAADGDKTIIDGHDAVDMTWYGNYDQVTSFPDGTTPYRRILMHYTMGCASAQCSDWDYTTRISLMENTGVLDSTVAVLDTITLVPLVVDTTWNVFDVLRPHMLGEVITPYGGYMANNSNGFNNSWNHTHTFDVTDFAHLLQGDNIVRAFFDGWSNGFSVSLKFEFIEGTPHRPVTSLQNYYTGRLAYTTQAQVEADRVPSKDYTFPAGTTSAKLRINKSGHGSDDTGGCAEFCQKYYQVHVNNNNVAGNVYVWRDDCGDSHTWPQGGTWLFSREGWCPGERSSMNEFEIGEFMDFAGTNALDIDLQSINWSGDSQPSYYLDVQLVTYGDYAAMNDAQLADIITPTTKDDYSRMNPSCNGPVVKIKNMGSLDITSVEFQYGVGDLCTYIWNLGSVAPDAYQEISLPAVDWGNVDMTDPKFEVSIISVNGVADEYEYDNSMFTEVELPTIYSNGAVLEFLTNNRASENSYTVLDINGDVVVQRAGGSMSNSTLYTDDLQLDPGCYSLYFKDIGHPQIGSGDGLSHWVSTQYLNVTSGYIRMKNSAGNIVESFNPDFGNELHYSFVVGPDYSAAQGNCDVSSSVDNTINDSEINIFPNPSTGKFQIALTAQGYESATYSVLDLTGKVILQAETRDDLIQLDLNQLSNGIYLIQINSNVGTVTKELVITK